MSLSVDDGLWWSVQGEWFCDACVARGVQPRKPAASPQKPAKPEKVRKAKPAGYKAAAKQKKVGSAGAGPPKKAAPASARVHMAAPAVRVVSGARRERNSNKHKRLFLPGEPGGLTVTPQSLAWSLLPNVYSTELNPWAFCAI